MPLSAARMGEKKMARTRKWRENCMLNVMKEYLLGGCVCFERSEKGQ